jgi:hypothetical protein
VLASSRVSALYSTCINHIILVAFMAFLTGLDKQPSRIRLFV